LILDARASFVRCFFFFSLRQLSSSSAFRFKIEGLEPEKVNSAAIRCG
jgi:hypothetical protein